MKFRLTDYLITPADIFRLVWGGIKKLRLMDYFDVLLLVIIGVVLRFVLHETFDVVLFQLFIVAMIVWDLDSRIAIGAGLLGLISIPILQTLFNQTILVTGDVMAEQVAIWVYYSLVIGVGKQIVDYLRESRKDTT